MPSSLSNLLNSITGSKPLDLNLGLIYRFTILTGQILILVLEMLLETMVAQKLRLKGGFGVDALAVG